MTVGVKSGWRRVRATPGRHSRVSTRWRDTSMNARSRRMTAILPLLVSVVVTAATARAETPHAPHIDPNQCGTGVNPPSCPLVPGTRFVYRETAGGETTTNEVTVLAETRTILGVACTIVHDVVRDGDKVREDTYDWYAQDTS